MRQGPRSGIGAGEQRMRGDGRISPHAEAEYHRKRAAMYAEQGRNPDGTFPDVTRVSHREARWAIDRTGLDTFTGQTR